MVLMDTTRKPSPAGKVEDEDKAAEKVGELGTLRNEDEMEPRLDSSSVSVPSSSPSRNSLEIETEVGNSASPTATPTSTHNLRRRTRSVKVTTRKQNESTEEAVKKKKFMERKRRERLKRKRITDFDPSGSGGIDNYDQTSNSNDQPVSSQTCGESNKRQQQSCKSDSISQTKTKPHVCKDCGNGFTKKCSLLRHIRQFHSNVGKQYECETCKQKFFFSNELRKHTRIHIGSTDELMRCLECGVGFNQPLALYHHYRLRHNLHDDSPPADIDMCDHITIIQKDPLEYQCEVCKSRFRSKYIIPYHELMLCDKKKGKRFTCKACSKVFCHKRSLERHMTTHSGYRKRFLCDTCKQPFTRPSHLKQHLLFHTGDKLVKCPECKAGFNNKTSLILHLRFHKKRDGCESFKCQKCGKESRNETYFCRHLFSHTADNGSSSTSNPKRTDSDNSVDVSTSSSATPTEQKSGYEVIIYDHISIIQIRPVKYQCNFCKVKFWGRSRIINHKLCPTAGVILPNYNCKECGQVFRRECELTNHLRSHSDKKNFVCKVCNAKFSYSRNLNRHGKCHSKIPGKRLLKCHICGAKFNSKRSLASHVVRHEAEDSSSSGRFECQICATSFAQRHDRDEHIRLMHQPKVFLRRLDSTDHQDYPVHPDNDSATLTTVIDQWENSDVDTASPFLYLEGSEPPSSPPPRQNSTWHWDNEAYHVSTPTFTSALEAVESHLVNVSEWPQWNLLSHPGGNGTDDGNPVISKPLMQQMVPPVKKPELERLEHATVFVVALPMPIIYLPTGEMFLIDQDFKSKSFPHPDTDMLNIGTVEMEKITHGYGLNTKGGTFLSSFTSFLQPD